MDVDREKLERVREKINKLRDRTRGVNHAARMGSAAL